MNTSVRRETQDATYNTENDDKEDIQPLIITDDDIKGHKEETDLLI